MKIILIPVLRFLVATVILFCDVWILILSVLWNLFWSFKGPYKTYKKWAKEKFYTEDFFGYQMGAIAYETFWDFVLRRNKIID